MKKVLGILMVLVITLAIVMPATVSSAKQIRLKIGAVMPPKSTTILGPLEFIKIVEARTNNQVKFDTFWGGSVVKKGEDLEGVQSGLLDVAVVNCTYYPDKLPLINIQFPVYFAPTDPEMLLKLYGTMFKSKVFTNDIERYNTKFLFAAPVPGKDLISKNIY